MADVRLLRDKIRTLKWLPVSLNKYASQSKIDQAYVTTTLDALDKVFCKRDSLVETGMALADILNELAVDIISKLESLVFDVW